MLYSKICQCYYLLKFFLYEVFYTNVLVVHGYFPLNANGKIGCYNLGDDLNLHLLSILSGCKIVPYKYSVWSRFLHKKRYSCIGSIISSSDKNTMIWGTGAIEDKLGSGFSFKQICAVRGPLTRNLLEKNGIKTPPIYGDPALLISRLYFPIVKIKYKIGIIPHYVDLDNPILSLYQKEGVKIINFHVYDDWKTIVNEMLSCELIFSSSLHGIIISDSYGIPNIWCKFSNNIYGGDFKYHDYLLSVKRDVKDAFFLNEYVGVDSLYLMKKDYCKPDININTLLNVCPFKIL